MRHKNLTFFAIGFLLCLAVVSSVSAEIMLTQPKGLYSLGDELNIEVKLDSLKTGYLDVDLVCESTSVNIYHNVPEGKTVSIKRKLTPTYIQDLNGNCYVSVNYADQEENTQSFEISKAIEIDLQAANLSVKAGENINLKGVAYKKNGQLVGQIYPAFVEAVVVDNTGTINITKTDVVSDGQFNLQLVIPETTHAGRKSIILTIYDKDDEDVLNSEESATSIEITQEPAKINLALDKLLINPGESVTMIPFLYDKAGDPISGRVSLTIFNSKNKTIYSEDLNANEEFIFNTNTTTLPGNSRVLIEKNDLSEEKSFQLSELKQVSANIQGNILTITNTGNVDYYEDVSVKIGEKDFIESIELDYGDKIDYEISAPDGEYEITVKESAGTSDLISRSGISLTGNAISMREAGVRMENLFSQYPIVWIFIIIVIAMLVWIYYHKYQRQKRIPQMMAELNKDKLKNGGVEIIKPEQRNEKIDEITLKQGGIKKAEQVLVLQGQKQPVAVIAIKLKENISGIADSNFKKAIEQAHKFKAVSYISGDTVLLIFSPLITKTFKNEETAIKVAQNIDKDLKEHNRKFRKDLISYGIGVNTGDIINKLEDNVLKFTNIGKTIGTAKRIAEVSSQTVLLSKETHEKTMSIVKTEKVASGGMDLFSITRVVDSENSSKFIQEFLRRNK